MVADDDIVPMRKRSLEVFGHEKDLDKLLAGSLFAEGRLTPSVLRCYHSHPPLPARRVHDGNVLLAGETLTRSTR